MTTVITQARLPKTLVTEMDTLVKKGIYTNKSDFIREAIRRLLLEQQKGTVKNKQDSIKQVKNARNELSKKKINLDELNNI